MQKKNRTSRVYLLRCWQERETASGQQLHWRFLVERVLEPDGRRKGFTSLNALFAFLQAELSKEKEEGGQMSE